MDIKFDNNIRPQRRRPPRLNYKSQQPRARPLTGDPTHTVIAAPAAGRVSTSPFPRGESESESEISPPPSSLRPPPAAAPAAPARDALRGRPTARRPRPCRRPPLPRSPFPVPAASPPRALRPRQPLLAARREPAPPPPPGPGGAPGGGPGVGPRASLAPPGVPRAAPVGRAGDRAPAAARGGGAAPAAWRGRGVTAPRASPAPVAAVRPVSGPACALGHRRARAHAPARPRAPGAGGGGSSAREDLGVRSPPPPVWCGPSEVRPRMPIPPAPCEHLGDAAFTRGWVFTEDLSAPGRAAHTCGRLRTETLPGFGSVRPEWLLAARSELPVPPRKALRARRRWCGGARGRWSVGGAGPFSGTFATGRSGDGSELGGSQVVLRKRGSRRSESRSPGHSRSSPWDRPGVQTPGDSRNPQTAREASSFCMFGSHFLLVSQLR
ncbi:translation initiation factor IF-2-like [Acinonyx jubatus]|uniref:Translation initiation factor IF-2-like n=1 Tax=Acinonyx jubatus TaxID=32536 RepID=A0ABM3P5T2_ACIJB|nr:translation initiation factor IF-2-like [Acinonyx jubatus]